MISFFVDNNSLLGNQIFITPLLLDRSTISAFPLFNVLHTWAPNKSAWRFYLFSLKMLQEFLITNDIYFLSCTLPTWNFKIQSFEINFSSLRIVACIFLRLEMIMLLSCWFGSLRVYRYLNPQEEIGINSNVIFYIFKFYFTVVITIITRWKNWLVGTTKHLVAI